MEKMGRLIYIFFTLFFLSTLISCRPDIPKEPYKERTQAVFDPENGIIPLPNDLLKDPKTGLVNIPTEKIVANETMEDFIKNYINTLDGFIPSSVLEATFSDDNVDEKTLTEESIKIYEITSLLNEEMDLDKITISEIKGFKYVFSVDEKEGKKRGKVLIISENPYENGKSYGVFLTTKILDKNKNPIQSSLLFNFLKSRTPLIDENGNINVTLEKKDAEEVEKIRKVYSPVFDYFENKKKIIKRDDVVLFWIFTIHSDAVAEFSPSHCIVPSPSDMALKKIKEALDGGSLSSVICHEPSPVETEFFKFLADMNGFSPTSTPVQSFSRPLHSSSLSKENIKIFDLSENKLSEIDGLKFEFKSAKFLGTQRHNLTLIPPQPLLPSHKYLVVLLGGLKAKSDEKIFNVVSSPLTFLLKSKKPLFKDGKSLLEGILSDKEAQEVEELRKDYSSILSLLEDAGIGREKIISFWTFTLQGGNEIIFSPSVGYFPFPNDILLKFDEETGEITGINIPQSPQEKEEIKEINSNLALLDGFSTTAGVKVQFLRPPLKESLSLTPDLLKVGQYGIGFADITDVKPDDPATLLKIVPYAEDKIDVRFKINKLIMKPKKPLPEGRRFMVLLFDKIISQENAPDDKPYPIKVSPIFFLSRTENPLIDKDGKNLASSILSDEDATLLEGLRVSYKPIFDNLQSLGVGRERVLLFFTFTTLTIFDDLKKIKNEMDKLPVSLDSETEVITPSEEKAKSVIGKNPSDKISKVIIDGIFKGFVLLKKPDITNPEKIVLGKFDKKNGKWNFRDAYFKFDFVYPDGTPPFKVIIFQHPYRGERHDVFKIANELCEKGFALISIDAPYHGEHPVKIDGKPSGDYFFSSDPQAISDNLRESSLDISQVVRFLKGDLNKMPEFKINTEKFYFLGVSIGGLTGILATVIDEEITRAVFTNAGGRITKIFEETENKELGEILNNLLKNLKIEKDSVEYDDFIDKFQWGLERGDPLNFASYILKNPKSLMLQMATGDNFIPNETTQELKSAMGLSEDNFKTYGKKEKGLCHEFFLGECDEVKYPDAEKEKEKAHKDAINFFEGGF